MKNKIVLVLAVLTALFPAMKVRSHSDDDATRSAPGSNVWNQAEEPTNWWQEIKQAHGHVGPWNVLGWRMGKAALRELNSKWGDHELDVVCHVPLAMPYSCTADGLVVGTGNSLGRLDIRLAEALSVADIHVSIRRKDGKRPVLILKPSAAYLEKIQSRPASELEKLSHECEAMPERDLFVIEKEPAIPRD